MEERNLICIGCPMGCPLTVEMEGDTIIRVNGNTCKRGDSYARSEVTAPVRTITSTVKVLYGKAKVVSVKTRKDIPKEKIFACMKVLKELQVKAPVHIGDVIVADIADTGVDIIATKTVEALSH